MRILLISLVLLVFAIPAHAEHHGNPDKTAIKAAVMDYFHGQGEASAERLNRAFARGEVTMVGVMRNDEGEESLRAWKDMGEVLDNWAANENPPGGDRDGEILDMHITDGRIATVTFRYTDRFYDAFTLVKVDGQWKIASKVFILQ